MATISRLTVGHVVWSVESQNYGRKGLFPVRITEIDPDGNWVMASWNGNRPQRFWVKDVKKWKVNKPQPKGKVFGLDSY